MTISSYKKVVSQYSLIKIKEIINKYKIPKFQRNVVNDRVNILSDNVLSNFNPITPIYFCMYKNERYVIDGQHRLECYKSNTYLFNENIPIIDIFIEKKEDMDLYFKLINDTMILNDIWIDEDKVKKDIITETYTHFTKKYPKSFKVKGIKRPYLNLDKFLTQLTELYNNEDLNINSSKEFILLLEDLNQKYSKKDVEWFPSKGSTKNSNIITTLKKNNCLYFGMLPNSWTKHLIELPDTNNQKSISLAFRQLVWLKYCDKQFERKCLCCDNNIISVYNFECGHILSKNNGGHINIDNIIPICSFCNKSMGDMHMSDYMKKLNYKTKHIFS
jgi:hypothetical protein